MKYLLWLDDDKEYRKPTQLCPNFGMKLTWAEGYFKPELLHLPIVWVETYEQFVNTIVEKGMPEMVSFDNDLGQELEGKHCAKWLFNHCVNNDLEMPLFSVHSANPIAAKEIHNICEKDWKDYQIIKLII